MNTDYPDNWKAIATQIKERDGWRCTQCGVHHGDLIIRSSLDGVRYLLCDESDMIHYFMGDRNQPIRLSEIPEEFEGAYTRVQLSVHHIGVTKADGSAGDPTDKADCRPENLTSLCARCHFSHEQKPAHAAKKRRKMEQQATVRLEYEKRQMTLWEEQ